MRQTPFPNSSPCESQHSISDLNLALLLGLSKRKTALIASADRSQKEVIETEAVFGRPICCGLNAHPPGSPNFDGIGNRTSLLLSNNLGLAEIRLAPSFEPVTGQSCPQVYIEEIVVRDSSRKEA